MINHLLERYGDRVRQLALSLSTFKNLIIKWEQNNEPPPAPSTSGKDGAVDSALVNGSGATSK